LEDGRPVRFVALRDIAERKRAELALLESESRFRTIVEGSPIPLWINRRRDGVILFANPKAGAVLGLPAEDVIGRQVRDFCWNPKDLLKSFGPLYENGFIAETALQMRRADGERISTVHSLRTLTYENEAAVLGSFLDITERLHLDQFAHVRQAQRRNQGGDAIGPGNRGLGHAQIPAQRFDEDAEGMGLAGTAGKKADGSGSKNSPAKEKPPLDGGKNGSTYCIHLGVSVPNHSPPY
jgi:PAS domain S-box-containing protein